MLIFNILGLFHNFQQQTYIIVMQPICKKKKVRANIIIIVSSY